MDDEPPVTRSRSRARLSRLREIRDRELGGLNQNGRRNYLNNETFKEKIKTVHEINGVKELKILNAVEHDLVLDANRKKHHTDEYEHDALIIRRRQPFEVELTFDRKFINKSDELFMQLTTGDQPMENKGSLIRFPCTTEMTGKDSWAATIVKVYEKKVKMNINTPCNAAIGVYSLYVECKTSKPSNNEVTRKLITNSLHIICNPWHEDDQVYIENEAERREYVLNETGRIWSGTEADMEPIHWNFGQFDTISLDAAMYLLEKGELLLEAKRNPVSILRSFSALTNSADDRGVLTGRWTDTFPKNSTVPWAWTGSVPILEKYMKRKTPVRFGQCWVFSGLLTTLLRAIGIPTRCVTNFESAHDTDTTTTIDYHWNEHDEPVIEMNDSVWNFHVWNECWIKRPDLPKGNDGWQAVDSTPQETSEGVMRCGPASLQSIKNGHVYFPHDSAFIFSEVNGDKVHWLIKEDGTLEFLSKETSAIGRNISTKAVGSNKREDITHLYKYKEGSDDERLAVKRAYSHANPSAQHGLYDAAEPDVELVIPKQKRHMLGDDITVKVTLVNHSTTDEHQVLLHLTAVGSFYTGVANRKIEEKIQHLSLQSNQRKDCSMIINAEKYMDLLVSESIITVYAVSRNEKTKEASARLITISIHKPSLTIEAPNSAKIKEKFTVRIIFKNPLNKNLNGAMLQIEGIGLLHTLIIDIGRVVKPGEEIIKEIEVKPTKSGKRELIATFSSNELNGITGDAEIDVRYTE